jgi:very-short-patch-repair endonuclease
MHRDIYGGDVAGPARPGHRELIKRRLDRLIDIGRRNRAIYFRQGRAALKLKMDWDDVPDLLEGRRVEVSSYFVGRMEFGVTHRFDTEMKGAEVIDVLDRLRYSVAEEERERGYSSLYIVFGLLKWSEKGEFKEGGPQVQGRRALTVGKQDDRVGGDQYVGTDENKEEVLGKGKSDIKSPLVIAKCRIETKLDRRSGKKQYFLQLTDELKLNPSLVRKMRADYGIDLERFWEEAQGVELRHFYASLRENLKAHGWGIDESFWIARLSFENQAIYEDGIKMLDGGLFDNCLVARSLCGDESVNQPEGVAASRVDEFEVEGLETPLRCDSAQAKAIILAEMGRSLVVHGPPGTGKSQLIANLLARSVIKGRRVLFVTEKRDAAEVVHDRLERIGLAGYVLHLHGDPDKRRDEILRDLDQMLQLGLERFLVMGSAPRGDPRYPKAFYDSIKGYGEWVGTARLTLEELARVEVETGLRITEPSVLQRMGRLAERWRRAMERWREMVEVVAHPGLAEQLRSVRGDMKLLQKHRAGSAQLLADWRMTDLFFKSPDDGGIGLYYLLFSSIGPRIFEDPRGLADLFRRAAELAMVIGGEDEFLRCIEDVGFAKAYAEVAEKLYSVMMRLKSMGIVPTEIKAKSERLQELVDDLASYGFLGRVFRRGRYKVLVKEALLELGVGPATRLKDIREALELAAGYQDCCEDLRKLGARRPPKGRLRYEDLRELPGLLGSAGIKVRSLLNMSEASGLELPDLLLRLSELMDLISRLGVRNIQEIRQLVDAIYRLRATDLHKLVREMLIEEGKDEFMDLLLETLDLGLTPGAALSLSEHFEHIERMPEAPKLALKHVARFYEEIETSHDYWWRKAWASVRERAEQLGDRLHDFAATIRREVTKKRKKLTLKLLLERYWEEMLTLKPAVIASPYTVHMFPKMPVFDVVVFDEASQIRLEKALTSIARGHAILVIGDEKQMPPSFYFERRGEEEDFEEGGEPEDGESLLERTLDIRDRGLFQSVYLEWYYRGEHESLITFSNREFYGDRLIVLPSRDDKPRCSLIYLPRARYRPGKGLNEDEARTVLKTVVELVGEDASGDGSIMVVAMNIEQQGLIMRLLEKYIDEALMYGESKESRLVEPARIVPDLGRHVVETGPEQIGEPIRDPRIALKLQKMMDEGRLTVRNLETVQGSESDTVIISLTYGKGDDGRIDGRFFGPLNREGGERRINVLVSRARRRVIVVSSITSRDLGGLKDRSTGLEVLRRYLEFLENGCSFKRPESKGVPESYFERLVISELERELRNAGIEDIELVPQVGAGRYRIDIGVKKRGGEYILGIECDGATFHSHKTARDRDYIRQKHLERLGWRIYRVWSSDWWSDRKQITKQLVDEVRKALGAKNT